MNLKFLFAIWILLVFVPLSSCTLLLENSFNDIYNINEEIQVNFSIEKKAAASGYVEIYLDCDDETFLVKKEHLILPANEKVSFDFKFPAEIRGECKIKGEFDGEVLASDVFVISREINIDYSIDNKFLLPLDKIFVNGTAEKENGDLVDGIIILSIPDLTNKILRQEIKNGKIDLSFEIDEEAAPGKYDFVLEVLEKDDDGNTLNYGKEKKEIIIKAVPSRIKIVSEESVKPPKNFSMRARLSDQAGNLIKNESLILKLFNLEEDKIVLEKMLENNGEVFYFFESNSTKEFGWDIHVYYGNLHSTKRIWVEDNEEIFMEILEDSGGKKLIIKNIGNVQYDGILDLFVENSSFSEDNLININLSKGESLEYPLDFSGNYNISIFEKDLNKIRFENVYLTGYAVFSDFKLGTTAIVIGLFIFLILIGIVFYFFIYKKGLLDGLKKGRKTSKPKKVVKGPLHEFSYDSAQKLVVQKKTFEKRVYMAVFHFEKHFKTLEKIAKKRKFTLNKLNENLYFTFFYGHPGKKSETRLVNFAREVYENAKKHNIFTSVVIDSDIFKNSARFLKEFALRTRKAIEFAEGKILISENIFDGLGIMNMRNPKEFSIQGRSIKGYFIR